MDAKFVYIVFWNEYVGGINHTQMVIFEDYNLAHRWKESNHPINGWIDTRAIRTQYFI
jgi:hypothetical protein